MKISRLLFPIGMIASLAVAAACGSTTPTTETPGDTTGSGTTPTPTDTTPVTTSTQTATPPTTSTAPTPTTSSTASNPPSGEKKWSELTNDSERGAFMGKVIVPGMKPVFQEFDGAKFAKFGCATCHGPSHKKVTEFLPKLTLAGGKFNVTKDKAAMLQFMMDKVTPEMAKLMGEKPYDPATKTGFGCGECHAIDMK